MREWDLHVVNDDSTVNAFVIASGKIFVFTGILKACQSTDALAGILAHEFSHVLSRHIGEQIGVGYLFKMVGDVVHSVLYAFSVNLPLITDLTGGGVDIVGPLVSSQPYSRMCESEADLIGLFLMAKAGYNPIEIVRFWEDMAAHDEETFEFLSDHPSHHSRADELRKFLPGAMAIYENTKTTAGDIARTIKPHGIWEGVKKMLFTGHLYREGVHKGAST
ncbi:hypothetical protein HDU97_002002 [Phlyctochytrium planicorne]|nr:hypothetical protein HDU97_002002 [Phlyctochytrium planicorne]